MTRKNTRKALLSSMTALLLCISMLIGTTFAWFTDSVTSGNNSIVAGNLDVELYNGLEVDDATKVNETTPLFEEIELWEPGVVAYENLTVANLGTLALKYQLAVNFQNENATTDGYRLSEILKIAVIDGGVQGYSNNSAGRTALINSITEWQSLTRFVEKGFLLPGEDAPTTQTYGFVIYWEPSENDNYWNVNNGRGTTDGNALHVELGVNLIATQYTHEEDSFDELYDEEAENNLIDESVSIVNNNGTLGEAVVLTGKMPYGELKITVPAGARLTSAETDTLRLTVADADPSLRQSLDSESKIAFGYSIYVEGIADQINPYTYANGNKGYNYEKIRVELPVGTDRTELTAYHNAMNMSTSSPYSANLNYNGTTGILSFDVYYFCGGKYDLVPYDTNFTVVYTVQSLAAKQITNAIKEALSGDTVSIPAAKLEDELYLDQLQDSLKGTENITLKGSGTESTVLISQGADIEANGLTVSDLSITSLGDTSVTGNETVVDNVAFTSYGGSYGLTVSGSDSTVKNSSFTGSGNNILMFANNSDTAASVTTVDNCTFDSLSQWGNNGGVRFQNYNGTFNITNSTIKVRGTAVNAGPSNSTYRGVLNVSDTTVDSTGFYISTVKSATLNNVTFDNTWYDTPMTFSIGGQSNTFTNCEFKSDVAFNSVNWGNKTVAIAFNNCTFNGTAITAENILDYFDFSSLIARDPNTTVTVDGVTVALS